MDKQKCLQKLEVFKNLPESTLDELDKYSVNTEYLKGDVVYRTGDKGKLFIIQSGRSEFYYLDEEGKKYIVDYFKAGNIFGDFQLNLPDEMYVEAVEKTRIYEVNVKDFFTLLANDPLLLKRIIGYLVERLYLNEYKGASLAIDNVEKKLTKWLIYLGEKNPPQSDGKLVTDRYTHEQLAQMLGVSRQIITTILNIWERKKLIQRQKKQFIFKKSDLLNLIKA